MTALPASLDPLAITLAAAIVRSAVEASHLRARPETEKQEAVWNGVRKIMAAGAFARDGMLFIPSAQSTAPT